MARFQMPYAQAVGADGLPLSGAKLALYESGSSTPANSYADATLATPNDNPVVADAGGRFGAIWLTNDAYKAVLKDSSDAVIWTADPVYAAGAGEATDYTTGLDSTTLRTWIAGMAAFLPAHQGGTSYIINDQNVVRNNLHDELGRAGYLPPSAATSESQTMMARGFLWAHKATGESAYLDTAKELVEAFIDYYAGGVEPTGSGLWGHHWIVNAGPDTVDIQGPAATPYTASGNLGATVAFTAGVGSLGSSLALVYRVYTGTVGWSNVFAGLNADGVDYLVDYYIASDGTKRTGRKADGSWGDVIGVVTGEPAGKIVLTDTSVTGNLLVSYSVYTGATIAVNTGFEAWPMWRALVGGEQVMATDALHWALDVFALLAEIEPAVTRWSNAVDRLVETFEDAATYRTSTSLFKDDIGGQFDSHPLTYWFGLRSGVAFHAPDTSVTASRDGSGHVQFDLGADGSREGFWFENGTLLVTTASTSVMTAELGADAAIDVEMTLTNEDLTTGVHTFALAGTGMEAPTALLAEFRSWPSETWQPGDTTFLYGTAAEAVTTNSDGTVPWPVVQVTVPDNVSGWGFVRNFTVPFHVYIRGRTGTTTLRLTDGGGWYWYKDIANTSTLTDLTLDWSTGWTTTGYQLVVGTPPASAVGSIASSLVVQAASACLTDIAWTGTAPTALAAGRLSKATIKWDTTSAIQLKVGDVTFSNVTGPTLYYQPGATPFNYGLVGGSARGTGGAFWQGPMYSGYQSITPWFEDGDVVSARRVYDLWAAAQTAYSVATGVSGPFAPVYVPETYENLTYGDANTFGWDGPDPNTTWGGFQYRAFFAASYGWSAWGDAVPKAASVCTRFLTWLDEALTDNTAWPGVPDVFDEDAPPDLESVDTHMIALCLRGTVHCRLAGADRSVCARVMRRLVTMLTAKYDATGIMAGSFPPTSGVATYYGFWHGEILAAISEALYYHELGEL